MTSSYAVHRAKATLGVSHPAIAAAITEAHHSRQPIIVPLFRMRALSRSNAMPQRYSHTMRIGTAASMTAAQEEFHPERSMTAPTTGAVSTPMRRPSTRAFAVSAGRSPASAHRTTCPCSAESPPRTRPAQAMAISTAYSPRPSARRVRAVITLTTAEEAVTTPRAAMVWTRALAAPVIRRPPLRPGWRSFSDLRLASTAMRACRAVYSARASGLNSASIAKWRADTGPPRSRCGAPGEFVAFGLLKWKAGYAGSRTVTSPAGATWQAR
ncbi:hypothetical protein DQ384_20225 [Sphaerisporangium album]|uniref:Uncharacterized protein n=1 Tax=Sphaerisporangium album TaxID=509200 RepID=A0A367FI54_9ACTN|nr:hypothetical protein DQ384_20225 [Sphaerisporangium album]